MIYDTIEHLAFYLPLPIRQEIMDFVQKLRPDTPEGKYPIRSTDIFASVSAYQTEHRSNRKPEVHRKYIDIQILLAGEEDMYCSPMAMLKDAAAEYDVERDVQFFAAVSERNGVCLAMSLGVAAVFFPQDVHTPQCTPEHCAGADNSVRKVVVKVNRSLWENACAPIGFA